MGKIEKAILSKGSVKLHVEYSPRLGVERVHVTSKLGVLTAKKLLAEGKVKEFINLTEKARIGWKKDGSWKSGVIFEGIVILNDA
jgi:hypothetical protein